jgi:serine/threonine protein kinase
MAESGSLYSLTPGQVVGGYTLVAPLGGGGMGTVWTVRDEEGHLFAMKLLRGGNPQTPQQQKEEEQERTRLRREALALSKIRHPGVASIVDMELDDALAFIVTERIEGENLRQDVADNGRYEGEDLELLAEKLASAVQAVHEAGVVHRDIKPTNIMISAAGPILVDFGIAMEQGESHMTQTGLVMGTPGFIAPEVVEGAESDAQSDWWSLASVLAFAATGRPVFGTTPIMTVLQREAAGSADLRGLPPRTAAVFRQVLSPSRAERVPLTRLLEAIRADEAGR